MNEWYMEIKDRILTKRPICERCHKRQATQLHHCLVRDSKKYHRAVTTPENLMPVCPQCHTTLEMPGSGYEERLQFAYDQIERGYDISEWYRRLPFKVREQWLLELPKPRTVAII